MVKYVIKRLLLCVLILFGVSVLLYILIRTMPQDYVDLKMQAHLQNGTVKQEDVDNMKRLYGLSIDYPVDAAGNILTTHITAFENFFAVFKSYISGYWNWLYSVFQGDLGLSFKYGRPVGEVIFSYMGISFALSGIALIFQFLIGIPLGILSATRQYSAMDYTVTVIVLMGISLPSFFLAMLLLSVFSKTLNWFPYQGLVSSDKMYTGFRLFIDKAWHMVLPVTTLLLLSIGGNMRFVRTNMLEVLNADYIRTARAKGCSEKRVVYKHAFRNTLVPIVTGLAGVLPGLFGGAMITETVYAIPGIGKMALDAMNMGDIPFIMGYNMFLAILSVLGTLLADLAYVLVDPRIKITR
ncbi:MAG: ABC transporter permease [Firmicutes bacterium]|nr:ABC transporter permease [Bacillota bacterium]